MTFSGFPLEAIAFFSALEADNSKSFWTANKATYERSVKGPMEALLAEVDARYQPLKLFRPHRDVRFAKDKSPYKTHAGAVGESEGGSMHYVQLSASGLMTASGYYMMAKDQLEKFRAAVAAEKTGKVFESLVAHYAKTKGLRMYAGGEAPLKLAPKGYPKDHPRIEYLRWKGAIVSCEHGAPRWLATPKAKLQIEASWAAVDPLNTWLDQEVGPSQLEPPDGWGR